jgi:hypothetical protein
MRWHDFWCKLLKICENPYSEIPGTSPMVVLAAGGIGTSTDSARRPDHLRRRPGKWLAELGLGNSQLQQCFPGSFRFRVHQRYDYNEHFPGDIHCAYGF